MMGAGMPVCFHHHVNSYYNSLSNFSSGGINRAPGFETRVLIIWELWLFWSHCDKRITESTPNYHKTVPFCSEPMKIWATITECSWYWRKSKTCTFSGKFCSDKDEGRVGSDLTECCEEEVGGAWTDQSLLYRGLSSGVSSLPTCSTSLSNCPSGNVSYQFFVRSLRSQIFDLYVLSLLCDANTYLLSTINVNGRWSSWCFVVIAHSVFFNITWKSIKKIVFVQLPSLRETDALTQSLKSGFY